MSSPAVDQLSRACVVSFGFSVHTSRWPLLSQSTQEGESDREEEKKERKRGRKEEATRPNARDKQKERERDRERSPRPSGDRGAQGTRDEGLDGSTRARTHTRPPAHGSTAGRGRKKPRSRGRRITHVRALSSSPVPLACATAARPLLSCSPCFFSFLFFGSFPSFFPTARALVVFSRGTLS